MPTPITTLRLSPELAEWARTYAEKNGTNRTAVVRDLLQALRGSRLVVVPESAPSVINDGSLQIVPVMVCLNPK